MQNINMRCLSIKFPLNRETRVWTETGCVQMRHRNHNDSVIKSLSKRFWTLKNVSEGTDDLLLRQHKKKKLEAFSVWKTFTNKSPI